MNMNSKQTVSREEYHRLDNRVTCILQQRWSANEISQWVGMLKGKQQAVACAILRRRHPFPASLALSAITDEVPTSFSPEPTTPPCRHTQQMAALLAAAISWGAHARSHRSERHHPLRRHRPHSLYRPG